MTSYNNPAYIQWLLYKVVEQMFYCEEGEKYVKLFAMRCKLRNQLRKIREK